MESYSEGRDGREARESEKEISHPCAQAHTRRNTSAYIHRERSIRGEEVKRGGERREERRDSLKGPPRKILVGKGALSSRKFVIVRAQEAEDVLDLQVTLVFSCFQGAPGLGERAGRGEAGAGGNGWFGGAGC